MATLTEDNISVGEGKQTDVKRANEANSMPQKRLKGVESSNLELKEMVHTVLNMGEDELKELCQNKKIRIYGKPSMLENHKKN
jgi:hypothetical protein